MNLIWRSASGMGGDATVRAGRTEARHLERGPGATYVLRGGLAIRYPLSAAHSHSHFALTLMQLALFIGIGLAAGVLSGLFGIGGGVLIVPALMFLAKMAPQTATGTSLGALLLPVGALGAWQYWRAGHFEIRASLWLALGLFIGAWFGAKLALSLSPLALKRAFAVFLVVMAVRI